MNGRSVSPNPRKQTPYSSRLLSSLGTPFNGIWQALPGVLFPSDLGKCWANLSNVQLLHICLSEGEGEGVATIFLEKKFYPREISCWTKSRLLIQMNWKLGFLRGSYDLKVAVGHAVETSIHHLAPSYDKRTLTLPTDSVFIIIIIIITIIIIQEIYQGPTLCLRALNNTDWIHTCTSK